MSYTVNKTDGTPYAVVEDSTINTDNSRVTIIGKNYSGYGEFIAENFIQMLENGANASAPIDAITGQLWYDTSAALLKVYNGSEFKNLSAATASASEPTSNVTGDMWFDTNNSQLYVFDGASYILIGPSFTAGTGVSGAIVSVVQDSGATDHIVIKIYAEDAVIAVISKDAMFTLGGVTPIPGFTTISPGIQMALTVNGQVPKFVGTATNAALLDSVAVTGFLRSDDAAVKTAGNLTINDGLHLYVGTGNDLSILHDGVDTAISNSAGGMTVSELVNSGLITLQTNDSLGATKTGVVVGGAAPAVTLYYDGSSKIATSATGATVVGTLNATTNLTVSGTSVSLSTHNHTLDALSNTTITANAAGEILKWSGTAWINNTLAEAGIQPYDADIPTVAASQAEMEAGTEAANRTMNPLGVAQAIAALAGGGGGATMADDTTTNAELYPAFADITTGSWTNSYVSSTKLTYNPSTGALSAVDFFTTSDERLKENITPITQPMSIVTQMEGHAFTWKETGNGSYGFIAQELEKILPEVVATDSKGMKSVNYLATISILLEAVKELNTRVNYLESK